MKKYLTMILTVLFVMNMLMGCASSKQEDMPDSSFSKEDYQKLLALQLDDYKHMTISDYRSRVAKLTDTAEYRELLERFSQSETLYELKDTNETAAFLFYVLDPLTGEKWQSRNYSESAISEFPYPEDNARVEYTFTLTILDDRIMVKDYNDTRLGVIDAMQDILINKTKEELRNEAGMQAYIQAYVDDFLSYMQTPELSVAIEFMYFSLSAAEEKQQSLEWNDGGERKSRSGTEADYRSLFALKTPDYENLSLADFNSALLEWANENFERMERIGEDTAWNDFQVTLTDEELSFVKLTVFLSGMENGKAIQSNYIGQPLSPGYEEELPQKMTNENGAAWCRLYYQFSYNISDAETVTVGERDRQIGDMINAIRTFWNNAEIETILKMSESDIVQELKKISETYSTEHIIITTNEEQVQFECMEERGYMN